MASGTKGRLLVQGVDVRNIESSINIRIVYLIGETEGEVEVSGWGIR